MYLINTGLLILPIIQIVAHYLFKDSNMNSYFHRKVNKFYASTEILELGEGVYDYKTVKLPNIILRDLSSFKTRIFSKNEHILMHNYL